MAVAKLFLLLSLSQKHLESQRQYVLFGSPIIGTVRTPLAGEHKSYSETHE
jgi:hypothetical protein